MSVIPEPTIPTKQDIPAGKDKDSVLQVRNFADKHETVKAFFKRSQDLYLFHKSQSLRIELENRMDDIDKACRNVVAASKDDADKTPDITSWKPPQLNSALEILTANQCEILFPRNQEIGKFVPLINLTDSSRAVTSSLMKARNVLFEYSNEIDNRIPKYRNAIWRTNKYGDCVVEMGWKHEEYDFNIPGQKKTVGQRIVEGVRKAMGKPTVTKQAVDHSTLRMHDFKDVYCDMLLDDDSDERGSLHNQQGIEIRCRTPYNNLRSKQKANEYKNVEFLGKDQLYQGETPDNRLETRQSNAGEASDASRATGEYEVWERWMLAPIDPDTGEWNEETTQATWWWGVFCGRCDNQNVSEEAPVKGQNNGVVCLRLVRNPYPYDELPFTVIHAQLDDKGLMHKSYWDDSKSILAELQKVNNAYVYAKDMQAAAPWIAEYGAVLGTKTFDRGPTSLIITAMGAIDKVRRVEVNVNTSDNLAMIQYLEKVFWEDIMLMPKGFRGKEMGSRTSAAEATAANTQAAKPFLHRLHYLAYQLVAWSARKDAMYTAAFAPDKLIESLTGDINISEITPADMRGPLRFKMMCIDDYENNIMEKAEQDRFAQIWGPLLAPVIGKRGLINAGKWAFSKRGAPVEDIFPMPTEGDAIANANRENNMMFQGEWTAPGDNEDDESHIVTHTNFMQVLKTQQPGPGSYHEATLGYLQAHNLIHEQNQQKKQLAMTQAPGQSGPGQPATGLGTGETPATTGGEASQDMLGAMGGAM